MDSQRRTMRSPVASTPGSPEAAVSLVDAQALNSVADISAMISFGMQPSQTWIPGELEPPANLSRTT